MTYTHFFVDVCHIFTLHPVEQSRKLQGHGKDIHKFAKVLSLTLVFLQFPETDVHPENMFNIAGVFAVASWELVGDPG